VFRGSTPASLCTLLTACVVHSSTPAQVVDVTAAAVLLKAVSFIQPRGKFDVALFVNQGGSRMQLLNKDGAAVVTASLESVAHVLVLEKPPEATAKANAPKTVYLMLPLSSGVTFGKQVLSSLVFCCTTAENVEVKHPVNGDVMSGTAPEVLAQLMGIVCAKPVEAPSVKSFRSSRGHGAVMAHVKVTPGCLFPLRCGLAFVSSAKAVFLPTSKWDGITVGRGGAGGANSTFDLVVDVAGEKAPTEFGLISREELPLIQEYVAQRKRVLDKMNGADGGAPVAADGAAGMETGAAAPKSVPDVGDEEDDDDSDEDDEDFRIGSDGDDDSGGSGGSSDDEGEGEGKPAGGGAAASDDSESEEDVSRWGIKKQRTE
jgi:Histone chaperone Rttp106-like